MATRKPRKKTSLLVHTGRPDIDDAAAVVSAAAGLATTVIASAATDATRAVAAAAGEATKALATAASTASQVVTDSAKQALSEFPRMQEDIREIRTGQNGLTSTLTSVVTEVLNSHTSAQDAKLATSDGKLTSIAAAVEEIRGHMVKQNGRLAKAETSITRQNLVLFGLFPAFGVGLIAYVAHAAALAGGFIKYFFG